MLRVGIYNRCSTQEEAQKNALEIQVLESREVVLGKRQEGWVLAEQYVELRSGTNALHRQEYQRMLQDMKNEKLDIIVIKSIDRLMRNTKDWFLFLELLLEKEMQLYIYLEQRFYDARQDQLLAGIKAMIAEQFSRDLSEKIKNAHRRRQEKGTGLNITKDMFGWDKIEKDVYVVNELEAVYYRRACQLALMGWGYQRISNQLYIEGARGKQGGKISSVQWRNMLLSERAVGDVVLRKTEYDFLTKKQKQLPKEEWIVRRGVLPALVEPDYHKLVVQSLAKRKRGSVRGGGERKESEEVQDCENTQGREKMLEQENVQEKATNEIAVYKGKHFLSGKLVCACCQKPYYYRKRGKAEPRFYCSSYLREGRRRAKGIGCDGNSLSEQELVGALAEQLVVEERRQALIKRIEVILQRELYQDDSDNKKKKEKARIIDREMQKLEEKQQRLLQYLLEEVITKEDYEGQRALLTKRKEVLLQEYEQQFCEQAAEVKKGQSRENTAQILQQIREKQYLEKAIIKIRLAENQRVIIGEDKSLQIHKI